jgi:hypothetical protein
MAILDYLNFGFWILDSQNRRGTPELALVNFSKIELADWLGSTR